VLAGYHLIWTAYGWWLPNDPRGSMSRSVRSAAIAGLGELHYGRKRIQPAGRAVREFQEASRPVLKSALLKFTEDEILTIADAFAKTIRERSYTCYACAIMPDHIHILIRKHRDQAETMIAALQDASYEAIRAKPQAGRGFDHPVWGGPGWKVYLETVEDMYRTIRYIELNPIKANLPKQIWPFVKVYNGWLPGQVKMKRAKPQARWKPDKENDV
jgi:REP element-mobilizing transposase RayT